MSTAPPPRWTSPCARCRRPVLPDEATPVHEGNGRWALVCQECQQP